MLPIVGALEGPQVLKFGTVGNLDIGGLHKEKLSAFEII